MAKADVGEELRQRWGTSEDLEEDLEEESEPIHHCSPHLQRPRHVHLCGSHALHDPRSMIDDRCFWKWEGSDSGVPRGGGGRRFWCST